jgi:hypothetical protein
MDLVQVRTLGNNSMSVWPVIASPSNDCIKTEMRRINGRNKQVTTF